MAKSNYNKNRNNKNGNRGNRSKSGNRKGEEQQRDMKNFEGTREVPYNYTPWYVRNKYTQQAVERISFNNVVGEPYPLDQGKVLQSSSFLSVYINPSIEPVNEGSASAASKSAVNRSSAIEYVMWSSTSGRTQQYAPADIGIYKLAIGSIMAMISHIRRGLGLLRYYSQRNLAYPQDILKAMGYTTNNVNQRSVLNFIDQLNYEIRLLNAMKFPKNLPYFTKWSSIFDDVFKDSESVFSQDFAFVPYTLWELDESYNTAGSGLRTIEVTNGQEHDFVWYLNTLDRMINAVATSSTQQLIGSDMLNYARKESYELGGIPEVDYSYVVAPHYSAEACLHLHHIKPIGAPLTEHGLEGSTDSNDVAPIKFGEASAVYLTYSPVFNATLALSSPSIMDIRSDDPNLDEIVESQRYMAYIPGEAIDGKVRSTGGVLNDSYVVKCALFGLMGNNYTRLASISGDQYVLRDNSDSASIMAFLSCYNHAPLLPFYNGSDTNLWLFGETENIAYVPPAYAERVTHLEQLDLFTTAEMARYVDES